MDGMISWVAVLALTQIDPALPDYEVTNAVEGRLTSFGSGTLGGLLSRWDEGFTARHPKASVHHIGKGSATGPPALISRVAQLAPLVRPLQPAERKAFEADRGYAPTEIRIARHAVCIVVRPQNPLVTTSLDGVRALFSKAPVQGIPGGVRKWGDVGLAGAWQDLPVSLYGRNAASAVSGFMRSEVMKGTEFKDEVKEQPGDAGVVLAVAGERFAAGIVSMEDLAPGVRALGIGPGVGVFPAPASVRDGSYPLARSFILCIDKPPGRPLDSLVSEFLRYALSKQGQADVELEGFVSLSAEQAEAERRKLE
jgi:phosphate transport system substrate-binding protein